jgi:hypothetical protein
MKRGRPSAGPLPRPLRWLDRINAPQTEAEVEALRECSRRRRPYGNGAWAARVAGRLGLQASLRPRGRPRKKPTHFPPPLGPATDPKPLPLSPFSVSYFLCPLGRFVLRRPRSRSNWPTHVPSLLLRGGGGGRAP